MPRTREESYKYHAPKPDQIARYETLRAGALAFARLIDESCPDSRERATAQTWLEGAAMWANKAIAVNE